MLRFIIGLPFLLAGVVLITLAMVLLEICFFIKSGHPEGTIELDRALIAFVTRRVGSGPS